MSYETDVMERLSQRLRKTEELKETIAQFNENIEIFERLVIALEESNRLSRINLGLERPNDVPIRKKY